MTTNDANENESAALFFDLAKLCEVHGQIAVLKAIRDACRVAADHEKDVSADTSLHERFTKAADAIGWAIADVQHAGAAGAVSLDMALTVMSES
jgi:hypothetical protein